MLFYRGVSQLFNVCTAIRARSSASFTVEYKQLLILLNGSVEHRIPVRNADLVRISVRYVLLLKSLTDLNIY